MVNNGLCHSKRNINSHRFTKTLIIVDSRKDIFIADFCPKIIHHFLLILTHNDSFCFLKTALLINRLDISYFRVI